MKNPPSLPDDDFCYRNEGFGTVSYEFGGDALELRDNVLFTETFDRTGMQWNGKEWVYDAGLGLRTTIVALLDVPAEAKKDWFAPPTAN